MRAQLFAIGLGIALLLPLAVVTGFNITHGPPKLEAFVQMTALTRFISILVAFAVFVALGFLRRRTRVAAPEEVRIDPIDRSLAA